MSVKQLSVFIRNEKSRLSTVSGILADAGIDIRALSLADTTNFGILRLIVDKPDKAVEALTKSGLTSKLTNVIAVELDDTPGSFAKVVGFLADGGIDIEYLYAFISHKPNKAAAIFRVQDNESAEKLLESHGITIINE